MQNTTQTENQRVTVRVNGWKYARKAQILPDQVGLQVTVASCNHCNTCQRRVREFTETLAGQPTALHQWRYMDDGATWLFLPRVKECEPLDLLRQVLGIWIDRL